MPTKEQTLIRSISQNVSLTSNFCLHMCSSYLNMSPKFRVCRHYLNQLLLIRGSSIVLLFSTPICFCSFCDFYCRVVINVVSTLIIIPPCFQMWPFEIFIILLKKHRSYLHGCGILSRDTLKDRSRAVRRTTAIYMNSVRFLQKGSFLAPSNY